ncbi:MAG: zinc-ribbon domain-containing protein [Chloroflexi bacterium]|nr:zinc-ribbon domain-containing protein [Chloroflexota bacterium]
MPFCPKCGKEVSEGVSFCPEYGHRLAIGQTLKE